MRARGSFYWLVLLSVLSLGFSMLHNNGALSPAEDIVLRAARPVQQAVANASGAAAAALEDLRRFGELRAENEALQRKLQESLAALADLRDTERENQALREAVSYARQHPNFKLVAARVVGRNSSNLLDTILIDQGRSSGIDKGMAVVWRGGLVGRVISATDHSARVLPITSPSSAVNVAVQGERANADGTAVGRPGGLLAMRQILEGQSVEPGEFVVTSGLGGGLPRGILVGTVVNIRTSSASVLKEADVSPFVGLEDLDTVQVIVGFEGE